MDIKQEIKKKSIMDLAPGEIDSELLSLGTDRYRADQIINELYVQKKESFMEMSLLPLELRRKLEEYFDISPLNSFKKRVSSDGSVKYLFALPDGKSIEAVYMPWENDDASGLERETLCISSMAGCPVGCAFCATATLGFRRNLSPGEIVGQILAVEKDLGTRITNIVFMGMGEPLLNYSNVLKSLKIMTDERTKLPGRKKITVSTAGVAPKIIELANIEKPPKLAISLHATTNGLREKLMPITKAHDIAKLMDSVEYYYRQTKLDVTYEYILFKGMNDGDEDAERLAKIGRRVPSRINIIPFNDISFTNPGEFPSALRAVTRDEMHAFAGKVRGKGVPVIVRDTFGSDIEAACGQLALSEEKKVNAS